ncbi:MAG: TIGR03905 family TSCPD domain-containing protein [Lachnospiraceae bacterium]|nr:TIGR03905 family TSCPD domain-containing protein [Lachnospiraceae bacterium]
MQYKTSGTCSKMIDFEMDGDTIQSVAFTGGCNGNLQGISSLVQGMNINDAIAKLKGIRCGFKDTSCPDQLARALEEYKARGEKRI